MRQAEAPPQAHLVFMWSIHGILYEIVLYIKWTKCFAGEQLFEQFGCQIPKEQTAVEQAQGNMNKNQTNKTLYVSKDKVFQTFRECFISLN